MAVIYLGFMVGAAFAQRVTPRDPVEPQQGRPHPKRMPRPAGMLALPSVDEKSMRALIDQLVSCGTRLSLSSWTDPKRGIGCGGPIGRPRCAPARDTAPTTIAAARAVLTCV